VVDVEFAGCSGVVTSNDVVFLEMPPSDSELRDQVMALREMGCRKLVILAEPTYGDLLRRRDKATGLCWISKRFTAFDLDWMESQMENATPVRGSDVSSAAVAK
ncbi:MAG: hypothetical protein IH988_09965, partial [Planctomycetes bacterium]|nr:hypothetical protein [Planctomycetota bacterium]